MQADCELQHARSFQASAGLTGLKLLWLVLPKPPAEDAEEASSWPCNIFAELLADQWCDGPKGELKFVIAI